MAGYIVTHDSYGAYEEEVTITDVTFRPSQWTGHLTNAAANQLAGMQQASAQTHFHNATFMTSGGTTTTATLQQAYDQHQQAVTSQQMIGPAISYGELGLLGGNRGLGVDVKGNVFLDKQVEFYRNQIKEGKIMVFSGSWTGEKFTGDVMTKPKLPSGVPQPDPVLAGRADLLEEYKNLSQELGLRQPHLEIEIFRQFMENNNISVFPLPAVIAYMDKKASQEAQANSGWCWRPLRDQDHLRAKDNFTPTSFGHSGDWVSVKGKNGAYTNILQGQSDYYGENRQSGSIPRTYDQTVPLHALRKVAAITKAFGDKVKLFVSDYAPLESIVYPDPFLMAVIPNPAMNRGVGRFVIDFWDEPGFGLEQQLGLKS